MRLPYLFIAFVASILLTTVPFEAFAQRRGGSGGQRRGGSDSGGGNICYLNGAPVLLEFAGHPKHVPSPGIRFPEDDEKWTNSTSPGFREHWDLFGFADMEIMSGRLKIRIQEILERNRPQSPILVSILERGILNFVASSYSTLRAIKADYAGVPVACSPENVRASIVYLNSMTAIVDTVRWNSLDLDSQAGLFFHENLRVLQHVSRGPEGNPAEFSDRVLQSMVRNLVYDQTPLDDSRVVRNFLLNMPFRIPTHDQVSLTWPVRYTRGAPTENISCRIAARTQTATTEISDFFNRMDRMCLFYQQAHTRNDILSVLDPLEREARVVHRRTGSSNMAELLAEIGRMKGSLSPDQRIPLAIQQILSPHRGVYFDMYFSRRVQMDERLARAILSYPAKIESGAPLTPLEKARYDEYRGRACHPRENLKELMATGRLNRLDGADGIWTENPRCRPMNRDLDRRRINECEYSWDCVPPRQ